MDTMQNQKLQQFYILFALVFLILDEISGTEQLPESTTMIQLMQTKHSNQLNSEEKFLLFHETTSKSTTGHAPSRRRRPKKAKNDTTSSSVGTTTIRIKTPCDLPSFRDDRFKTSCGLDYLGNDIGYVCDADGVLSRTVMERIHNQIKDSKIFYFCECLSAAVPASISDSESESGPPCSTIGPSLIGDEDVFLTAHAQLSQQKKQSQAEKYAAGGVGSNGDKDVTSDRVQPTAMHQQQMEWPAQYIRQLMGNNGKRLPPPVIIGVHVFAKFLHPHTRNLVDKYLPCASQYLDQEQRTLNKSSNNNNNKNIHKKTDNMIIDEERILNAYAYLCEEKWTSSSKCSPNLTILVFAGGKVQFSESHQSQDHHSQNLITDRFESYQSARLHIRHTYGDGLSLATNLRRLIREINDDNSTSMRSPSEKLSQFLRRFTEIYEEAYVHKPDSMPTWAAIAFGVCMLLSVSAVLLGNFVTSADRKGNRKTKNPNVKVNRKWRAGFSGGMWASVNN